MILVECYPDLSLLTVLGFGKVTRHMKGKGNILNQLKTNPSDIGIMDLDPGKISLKQMSEYIEVSKDHGIICMKHREKGTMVILIEPDLEGWLLTRIRETGSRPSAYGLPDDAARLHGFPRYDRNPGFRRCLNDLMTRDLGFLRLRSLLKDL
jgi:hypothetical protein